MEGPEVYVPADTALALGLGFHELTTNSVKHGSLSAFGGGVLVAWSTEVVGPEVILRIEWHESNGPPVSPPSRRGFGSQLLQRVLGTQVNGSVNIEYAPGGLRVDIELPLRL